MKFRPIPIFIAGAVFSAGVIGTTTWLRAADDNVITACANKKSGVLRYLTKGSCNRKTENQVTWNKTGIPGPAGAKGDSGAKGETGATGAAGAKGDTGAIGKNIRVIDAAGRDHGLALGTYNAGNGVDILFEGGIWTLNNTTGNNKVSGNIVFPGTYSDSGCTKLLWLSSDGQLSNGQQRGATTLSNGTVIYVKPVGSPFLGSTVNVYLSERGTCSRSTSTDVEFFTAVETISGPTFTPPFRLIIE